MQILALDTSTEYCSVALWRDGVVAIDGCHAGQRHSELLLPMIGKLLADAVLSVNQLDGIAFGMGPGSFTGLRIACGVAQGLAFAADLPVVGISTLQAMAEATKKDRVIACMDARMGEVYYAAYERVNNQWSTVVAPALAKPEKLAAISGNGWSACGNGFAAYPEALAQCFSGQLDNIDATILPHAREIATLAVPIFERGQGIDAADAAPLYLRNKIALTTSERQRV